MFELTHPLEDRCVLPSGTTVTFDTYHVHLTSRFGTRTAITLDDIKALHKLLRQRDEQASAALLDWAK